jgi:hypothetical protein
MRPTVTTETPISKSSVIERVNSLLHEEQGGLHVRVRGPVNE